MSCLVLLLMERDYAEPPGAPLDSWIDSRDFVGCVCAACDFAARKSAADIVGAVAIGEQTVMADAMEAFWEDMDEKAPDEFMSIEDHDLVSFGAFGSIILPGEGDLPVCRSYASKIRHDGPDLRRNTAAGGEL